MLSLSYNEIGDEGVLRLLDVIQINTVRQFLYSFTKHLLLSTNVDTHYFATQK